MCRSICEKTRSNACVYSKECVSILSLSIYSRSIFCPQRARTYLFKECGQKVAQKTQLSDADLRQWRARQEPAPTITDLERQEKRQTVSVRVPCQCKSEMDDWQMLNIQMIIVVLCLILQLPEAVGQ